jgi:hypothetical protein
MVKIECGALPDTAVTVYGKTVRLRRRLYLTTQAEL